MFIYYFRLAYQIYAFQKTVIFSAKPSRVSGQALPWAEVLFNITELWNYSLQIMAFSGTGLGL